jgi:hypothetical protein
MNDRVLNFWVVEDDRRDASAALGAIQTVMGADRYRVFWDQTLRWGADLRELPLQEDRKQVSKLDFMPDIVVLDLLDEEGEFAAGKYYEALRKEERQSELPASFVILWSVKTGLTAIHQFIEPKLKTDRRLMFTSTKTLRLLEDHLARCLISWRECQIL